MRSSLLWNVTQRILVGSYRRFGIVIAHFFKGQTVFLGGLKMEKISFPETGDYQYTLRSIPEGPLLWSSGQSFWLQIQRSRVRFPALPDFLSSSGSGTAFTQPREVN